MAALLFLADAARGTDFYWTNTSGGNWDVAANWSPNDVPGPSDNAFIVTNGTYTVTLNVNASVLGFTVGGDSGQQSISNSSSTLTINSAGQFNSNAICNLSGGTLGGSGTTTLYGTLNWSGGAVRGPLAVATNGVLNIGGNVTLGSVLTNGGTVNWLSGDVAVLNECDSTAGGPLVNLVGGLWNIQSDRSLYLVCCCGSGRAYFQNAGTVRKSAGSGTTYIQIPFYNSGTVSALQGTLPFERGLNLTVASVLETLIAGRNPGSQFGQFAIAGDLSVAGTLHVATTNGFVPCIGDTFRIMSWGSRVGGFSQASGFDLGGGLYFQGIADKSGLSLVTKSSVVPVPPPATNLVNLTVAFGDPAGFSFSPPGVEPFTFQWTFFGTNLPGETSASLVITNVQSANLGTYCAAVVDAFSVSNLYCATLSATNPPSISGQPSSVTTNAGNNITLAATANGAAPLRYQWRINGANIPGATNNTYTITNAHPTNGGIYSVLVANPVRVISSSNAKVKINTNALAFADNFAARGTLTGLSGAGSGQNTNATHETNEPEHAGKAGAHSVWLQWTAPANGVATFTTRGSAFDTLLAIYTGSTLTNLAPAASDDDQGEYFTSEAVFSAVAGTNYQIAVDGLSSASGDIVLNWSLDTNLTQIPKIVQHPVDVTASLGGSAMLAVFAASTTNLSYQWYLGGWLAIAGATNSTLTISNVSYLNSGTYSVEVTSATGQTVASLPASLEIGPAADSHSFDKLAELLQAVQAGGGGGGFARALRRGGGVTAQSVSFPSVSAGTLGSQIINNFNSTTEQAEPIHSDVIGGSSRWYLLTAATNGTMVIDTLGSDIDTLMSIYTGTNIFSLQLVASDNNGASDGVRSLVRFSAKPNANYLIAVDGVNGAQGNIVLNWRLGTPPNATGPAQSHKLAEGSSLLLEAGVSNNVTGPFYQWRRNGVNIPGATNATYSLNNLQFNQVGSYSVLVSNLVGAVTNAIATVSAQSPLRPGLETNGFRVSGSATQAVVLQVSTNFSSWTSLYTNGTPLLPINFLDTNSLQRPQGFYKLKPWP